MPAVGSPPETQPVHQSCRACHTVLEMTCIGPAMHQGECSTTTTATANISTTAVTTIGVDTATTTCIRGPSTPAASHLHVPASLCSHTHANNLHLMHAGASTLGPFTHTCIAEHVLFHLACLVYKGLKLLPDKCRTQLPSVYRCFMTSTASSSLFDASCSVEPYQAAGGCRRSLGLGSQPTFEADHNCNRTLQQISD